MKKDMHLSSSNQQELQRMHPKLFSQGTESKPEYIDHVCGWSTNRERLSIDMHMHLSPWPDPAWEHQLSPASGIRQCSLAITTISDFIFLVSKIYTDSTGALSSAVCSSCPAGTFYESAGRNVNISCPRQECKLRYIVKPPGSFTFPSKHRD